MVEYFGWPVALGVGIFFALGVVLLGFVSISYFTVGLEGNTDEENQKAGIDIGMCTLAFLLIATPFLVWAVLGMNLWRRRKKVAQHMKLYRQVKIEEVGKKLGMTRELLEADLGACIDKGYISGHLDPSTGVFTQTDPNPPQAYYPGYVPPPPGY